MSVLFLSGSHYLQSCAMHCMGRAEEKWRELSTESGDVFQLVYISSVQSPCSSVWTENVKLFFEFPFFRDQNCYIKQQIVRKRDDVFRTGGT